MPPPTLNSEEPENTMPRRNKRCLNTPFGARCFLTEIVNLTPHPVVLS